jgi:hypothetical protein
MTTWNSESKENVDKYSDKAMVSTQNEDNSHKSVMQKQ